MAKFSEHLFLVHEMDSSRETHQTGGRKAGCAIQVICDLGLVGIMANDPTNSYQAGKRSPAWLKVQRLRESEVVVGAYDFSGDSKEMYRRLELAVFLSEQV